MYVIGSSLHPYQQPTQFERLESVQHPYSAI